MKQLFHMPVKIIAGKDCVLESAALLSAFGSRCLLITGKHSAARCGALADVKTVLEQAHIDYEQFDSITANPLLSACAEAGAAAKRMQAQFIIAIGGGSVLDAAKAAALFATNRFENAEQIYRKHFTEAPLPLVVIGTTAGTGSEVSATAVITVDSTMEKRSITDPACFAKLALCDAKYTFEIPRDITVSTALDAFAHALEGWFSKKRNATAEICAARCLPEIFGILKLLAAGKTLTEAQRERMYYCSLLAGMVLCIGTLFPHMLGYTLTDKRGVPHGQACAVFDRVLIAHCATAAPERAQALFSLLGASKDEVLQVMDALICIDSSLTFTREELARYSTKWTDDNPKFSNVCGGFSRKAALQAFEPFIDSE